MTQEAASDSVANPARAAMWVTCKPCQYTWAPAFLPMEMARLAKLLKSARCPKCGEAGRGRLFMAREAEIVAALEAQKR